MSQLIHIPCIGCYWNSWHSKGQIISTHSTSEKVGQGSCQEKLQKTLCSASVNSVLCNSGPEKLMSFTWVELEDEQYFLTLVKLRLNLRVMDLWIFQTDLAYQLVWCTLLHGCALCTNISKKLIGTFQLNR